MPQELEKLKKKWQEMEEEAEKLKEIADAEVAEGVCWYSRAGLWLTKLQAMRTLSEQR